jgi:hypothetical protein
MTEEPFNAIKTKGVKFWGEKGWIEVSRGFYKASSRKFKPRKQKKDKGPYETKIPHQLNFIEAIRSRIDPAVPVEVGHRSCTVCNLGNISYELGRPVKWDPYTERFVNDAEAERFFHRQYRDGYSLPV